MAVGTTTAILLGIGAAGVAGSALSQSVKTQAPTPIPLPQPPSPEDSAMRGADIIRRKKADASQSIYTSPLGLTTQADVAKKVLLGQ